MSDPTDNVRPSDLIVLMNHGISAEDALRLGGRTVRERADALRGKDRLGSPEGQAAIAGMAVAIERVGLAMGATLRPALARLQATRPPEWLPDDD